MKKFVFSSAIILSSFLAITAFRTATPAVKDNTGLSPLQGTAVTKWEVDKVHSNVKFTVTHMVISEVDGSFRDFTGTIEHSKADFSDAKINFTIEVGSVDTDNEKRDGHLKSPDFFDAVKYPQMKFTSTSFKPLGNNKFTLTGNLTLKDITKPVTFDVTYGGTVISQGMVKAGFKAKATINRFDYNLKWSSATEAGGLIVSKEVDIAINAELNQVK